MRASSSTLALALVFLASACGPGSTPARCVEGASAACGCTDGLQGAQVCLESGVYGACQCTTPDAGTPDAGSDAGPDCIENYCQASGHSSGNYCNGPDAITCGAGSGGCAVVTQQLACANGCTGGSCSCGFDPSCLEDDCANVCAGNQTCSLDRTCAAPRYQVSDAGTVTDENTGLVWQQLTPENQCASDTVNEGFCNWTEANAFCASLSLGGYSSGWKLPTADQLFTTYDQGWNPPIVATAFPGVIPLYYWTATDAGTQDFTLSYGGAAGIFYSDVPGGGHPVRCVH